MYRWWRASLSLAAQFQIQLCFVCSRHRFIAYVLFNVTQRHIAYVYYIYLCMHMHYFSKYIYKIYVYTSYMYISSIYTRKPPKKPHHHKGFFFIHTYLPTSTCTVYTHIVRSTPTNNFYISISLLVLLYVCSTSIYIYCLFESGCIMSIHAKGRLRIRVYRATYKNVYTPHISHIPMHPMRTNQPL